MKQINYLPVLFQRSSCRGEGWGERQSGHSAPFSIHNSQCTIHNTTIMKKTILCTEDNPLHLQISQEESLRIEELEVSGYLDEDDYELLTEMSGEKGCLRYLDLYGVTESFPGPDDMGCFCIGEEDLAIYSGSFNDSIRLEKIIFPNNLIGIGHSSFN